MPRWRPCGTFWRMAERLRAHSTRLILDWPPHRVCIHRSSVLRFLHSPLLLIPLRGYPQNRRIRRVALLFSSPPLPLPSSLIFSYSFLSSLFCGFSVIRNGIAIVLRSELVRLRESGRFVEHTAFRAFSFPSFIHSVLLVNCLTCCLQVSFLFFSFCRYFGIKEVSRSNRLAFFSHR